MIELSNDSQAGIPVDEVGEIILPRVKIDTPGVTVELDAGEASVEALGKQALEMFKQASDHLGPNRTQVGFGAANEKRWTPDHEHMSAQYGRGSFAPAHLEVQQ